MGRLSSIAEDELTNIIFERGPGFGNAMEEEIKISRFGQINLPQLLKIESMVQHHYQIDKDDYKKKLKINLTYGMSYKAAVNLAKRHAKRVFAPNFEKLDQEVVDDTIIKRVNEILSNKAKQDKAYGL